MDLIKFLLLLIFEFIKIDWMEFITAITGSIIALSGIIAVFISIYTFRQNQKFIRKQQFESTFFNMMKQLEDIVSKLTIDDDNSGRDTFRRLYNNTEIEIDDISFADIINKEFFDEETGQYGIYTYTFGICIRSNLNYKRSCFTIENLKYLINNFGIRGFEFYNRNRIFDHYYRYLTTILQFIEDASYIDNNSKYINERYKYANILRSTLSAYELVFLFYYGLTFLGQDFKPLAEKYSMFFYLDTGLLAYSRRDKYLNLYEDFPINDGERYKSKRKGEKDKYYQSIYVKDPDLFKSIE